MAHPNRQAPVRPVRPDAGARPPRLCPAGPHARSASTRFQRRQGYRVRPTERHAPMATLRHPSMPDMQLELRVLDVSFGGALMLPDNVPMLEPGVTLHGVHIGAGCGLHFICSLLLHHHLDPPRQRGRACAWLRVPPARSRRRACAATLDRPDPAPAPAVAELTLPPSPHGCAAPRPPPCPAPASRWRRQPSPPLLAGVIVSLALPSYLEHLTRVRALRPPRRCNACITRAGESGIASTTGTTPPPWPSCRCHVVDHRRPDAGRSRCRIDGAAYEAMARFNWPAVDASARR